MLALVQGSKTGSHRPSNARSIWSWSLEGNLVRLPKNASYIQQLLSSVVGVEIYLEPKTDIFFKNGFPRTLPRGNENGLIARFLVNERILRDLGETIESLKAFLSYRQGYHPRNVELCQSDLTVKAFFQAKKRNEIFYSLSSKEVANFLGIKPWNVLKKESRFLVPFHDSFGLSSAVFGLGVFIDPANYKALWQFSVDVFEGSDIMEVDLRNGKRIELPTYWSMLFPEKLRIDFGGGAVLSCELSK